MLGPPNQVCEERKTGSEKQAMWTARSIEVEGRVSYAQLAQFVIPFL